MLGKVKMKWESVVSMITTNQQFNNVLPCSILFFLLNTFSGTDTIFVDISNGFIISSILLSFSLVMLSNAYFEVVGQDWKKTEDRYNWLALTTSLLSGLGMVFSLLAHLSWYMRIVVYVSSAFSLGLYVHFAVSIKRLNSNYEYASIINK